MGNMEFRLCSGGWITSNQIEAARIAMTRYIRRGGKVWIKIFPDKPVTKKPAETRMGKGKGSPEYWVAVVKPGRVMFELAGVSEEVAREALRLAMNKLPIRSKFIIREGDMSEIEAKYANARVVIEDQNADAVQEETEADAKESVETGSDQSADEADAQDAKTKAEVGGDKDEE